MHLKLVIFSALMSAAALSVGCGEPRKSSKRPSVAGEVTAVKPLVPAGDASLTKAPAGEISAASTPAEAPAGDATPAATAEPAGEASMEQPADLPATAEPVTESTVDSADEVAPPAGGNAKVLLGSPDLTAGIPGEGRLKIPELQAWLDEPKNHEPLDFELPLGLSAGAGQEKGLESNPLTRAKIELGRQLYFEPRLSYDQTVSCASCHHPDEGYAKHTPTGVGIKQQTGGRNSPVSYNRILSEDQFWDGRAGSLEDQAVGPIANPIEMGFTHDACVACLKEIEAYRLQFDKIFGELTIDAVGKAIASFERAIVTGPTPFDYYESLKSYEAYTPEDLDDLKSEDPEAYARYEMLVAGAKANPMSESAVRGRDIFFTEKGNCSACHVGPNLSDEKYHNLGVGMQAEKPDLGRFDTTGEDADKGAFKTPTIRNVALSYPYMHDGSQATLEEVVEWYAKGGHPNPNLSDKIKKLDLNDQDKKDLVEFMKACTGEFPKVETARLPEEIE